MLDQGTFLTALYVIIDELEICNYETKSLVPPPAHLSQFNRAQRLHQKSILIFSHHIVE